MIQYLKDSYFSALLDLNTLEQLEIRFPTLHSLLEDKRLLVASKQLPAPADTIDDLLALAEQTPEAHFYLLLDTVPTTAQLKLLEDHPSIHPGVYVPNDQPEYTCLLMDRVYQLDQQLDLLRRCSQLFTEGVFTLCRPEYVEDGTHYLELVTPYTRRLKPLYENTLDDDCASIFTGFSNMKKEGV